MACDPFGRNPASYFVAQGVVTQIQADWAQVQGGDPVENLLEAGLIEPRDLEGYRWICYARERGMAFADLTKLTPLIEATLCLPTDFARDVGVVPLRIDGDTLWAAFRNPSSRRDVEQAEEISGLRVIPVVAMPELIEAALERL